MATTTKSKRPAKKRPAAKRPPVKAPAKKAAVKPGGYVPPAGIAGADVLGVSELCLFLDVKRSTVHVWGYRDQLPPEDWPSINGFRAWKRESIVKWAAQTGRLPEWLRAEGACFEPEGGYKRKRRTNAEIAADRAAAGA